MDIETIKLIVQISLIAIFALIILGLVISCIRGFKKGLYKSGFRLVMFTLLFGILFLCLEPLANLIGKFDLSFLPIKTVVITNTNVDPNVSYYVPITNLFDTLKDSFEGFYLLFNAPNYAEASKFGIVIATALVKYVSFFVGVLIIFILGSTLYMLLWHLVIKRLIPKVVKKKLPFKFASMITNAVTYICCLFLFISPLSSIVNIANNASKKVGDSAKSNEIVQITTDMLDIYNQSIFANAFFNWTLDDSGLTLDSRFINTITSSTIENASFSLLEEVNLWTDLAAGLLEGITFDGDQVTVKYNYLLTSSSVEALFNALRDSKLVTYALPIAVEFACKSDMLKDIFDASQVQLDDINWNNELEVIGKFASKLLDSGILDNFLDSDGQFKSEIDIKEMIKDILSSDKRSSFEDAFNNISTSKAFSRAMPVVMETLIDNDASGIMGKFFVKDTPEQASKLWNDFNAINWGTECNILFSCLTQMYDVDEGLIDLFFMEPQEDPGENPGENPGEPGEKPGEGGDKEPTKEEEPEEPQTDLISIIREHYSEFKQIIVGKSVNNAVDTSILDSNGKNIVYNDQNEKIENRNYSLLDSDFIGIILEPTLNYLVDEVLPGIGFPVVNEGEDSPVPVIMQSLNSGTPRINYKNDFIGLIDTLEPLLNDNDLMEIIVEQTPITSLFDLSDSAVESMSNSFKKMDNSLICDYILSPVVKNMFLGDAAVELFATFGIDTTLVDDSFEQLKADRKIGSELGLFFDSFGDLRNVHTAIDSHQGNIDATLEALGEHYISLAKLLDMFYKSNIINPIVDEVENTNFFNIYEYVFHKYLGDIGFEFKEELKTRKDITWCNSGENELGEFVLDGENGAFATFVKVAAEKHLFSLAEDIADAGDNIIPVLGNAEKTNNVMKDLLTAVSCSKIMSLTMGDVLDSELAAAGLISGDVSFTNVIDWSNEAYALHNAILSLNKLNINLNSLDITAVSDVVALNDLLHSLNDSGIFMKKNEGGEPTYIFGEWLFDKVKNSIMINDNNMLMDPSEWNTSYGDKVDDFTIARYDFASLSKEEWGDVLYQYGYGDNLPEEYWTDPSFEETYFGNDTDPKIRTDEISKLTYVVYNIAVTSSGETNITKVAPENVGKVMNAISDVSIFRMVNFNMFDFLKSYVKTADGIKEIVSLDNADLSYLIDVGTDSLINDELVQELRKEEMEKITPLVELLRIYQSTDGLITSTGINLDKIDNRCLSSARKALKGLNDSYSFHRLGPVDGEDTSLTAFQDILSSFVSYEGFKEVVYNADSPLDIFYGDIVGLYPSTSTNPAKLKMSNLALEYFPYDFETYPIAQENEIDEIIESISSILGLSKNGSETESYIGLGTFNLSNIDIYDTSLDIPGAIDEISHQLLRSNMLKDAASNAVKAMTKGFDISGTYINMEDSNVYYFYLDGETNLEDVTNWDNTFTEEDLSSFVNLLTIMRDENFDKNGFNHIDSLTPDQFEVAQNFVSELESSNIFNQAGVKPSIDKITGDINISPTGLTVYEEFVAEMTGI